MKALLTLLAAGVLLAASVGTSAAAPITWSGNGHSYELVQTPGLTWQEAQADAGTLGAGWHLATITSPEEDEWVFNNVVFPYRVEFWLGGYQIPPDENTPDAGWRWVTGEQWSYTNFAGGEPNDFNGAGTEQYLAIWLSGAWNDAGNADAWYLSGYVAESPAPVPEPGTVALFGVGIAVAALLKRLRSRQQG